MSLIDPREEQLLDYLLLDDTEHEAQQQLIEESNDKLEANTYDVIEAIRKALNDCGGKLPNDTTIDEIVEYDMEEEIEYYANNGEDWDITDINYFNSVLVKMRGLEILVKYDRDNGAIDLSLQLPNTILLHTITDLERFDIACKEVTEIVTVINKFDTI